MAKRRDALTLIVLYALALTLRLVRRSPELLSSDAADLAADVTNKLCSGKPLLTAIPDLILFRLGGLQPLVVFTHGVIARALDIAMNPTSWEWSTILVSSASAPLAFLVGRRFGGNGAAIAWALFLAVSPIHVMLGRNLGAPWAYELNFQLALLWLSERHLTKSSNATSAALWSVLSAYLWCGNQMMGIFPVLGFAFLAHTLGRPSSDRFAFARGKVSSPWLMLPLVSAAALAYCTFVLEKGHLHHALFEKRKALGWYWSNFYSDMVHNLGYVPTWMCFAAFVCALAVPGGTPARHRIPLVYTLCYALPFLFLVSRATTLTRGYSIYGLTGLLGLVALLPSNAVLVARLFGRELAPRTKRWTQLTIYGLAGAFLVTAMGASAYRLYGSKATLGVKGFQGSFGPPRGAAAAAAFISRLADTDGLSGRVFSDAYGGTGLEPPIMRLYFKRRFFAQYDAARNAPWRTFTPRASEIDFAVIRPENSDRVAKHFPKLKLAATIFAEATDEPVLRVYARDYERPPERLSAREGVLTYAAAFPHFCVARPPRDGAL